MPSSSTADSSQETEIEWYFKLVYVRFVYSGQHREAAVVARIYSEILDQNHAYMMKTLSKDRASLASWVNRVARTARPLETSLTAMQKKHVQSKKMSERMWSASVALSDTADVLAKFGRHEECKRFCRHAEDVQVIARGYERDQAPRAV
jgi:hypothetical protein